MKRGGRHDRNNGLIAAADGKNKSSYKPIGLLLLAGALLASGSCYGFSQTMGPSPRAILLAGLGFFLGVVLFLTGFIRTIIWASKRIGRGERGQP